jgi:beta-glucosidase
MIPPYKRPSAPIEERVTDLLARMSLEEKIAQLQGTPLRSVESMRAMQRTALKDSRLGIPILFHGNGLQDTSASGVNPFPLPIALASSWDPALVGEIYAAAAAALRARGALLHIGPALGIGRDPRRGRIEQTFGEDPWLVTSMGVAAVRGLHDGKVLAAARAFAGPSLAREDADAGPAPVSRRELREIFFPPFEAVVRAAHVDAIVPSRNELDGVPSHANTWLLQEVLRREWAFEGAVLGDANGVGELQSIYAVARTPADASALAFGSGVDLDLRQGSGAELAKAVRAGRIPEARIDAATARVLALKFRAGAFENPYADAEGKAAARGPSMRAVALRAAQRAIILLKNDGTLPLTVPAGGKARPKIAIIDTGVVRISIRDAVRARTKGRAEILVPSAKIPAIEVARRADRIVLVSAENAGGAPAELLDALKALGKPLVAVIASDRPSVSVKLADQANALVAAWCLGEDGGKAVADVLFGDVNPGGKLPVTLPRNAGQLPLYYNAKPSARRGYLFDTSEPLYPFGWGLSYTTFELGAPRLSASAMTANGSVEVSVDVRNTGKVAGDETVQLYIRDKVSSVTRPVKELKGFQRVRLAAGERRTVTFPVDARTLEMWDEAMQRRVEPGEFEIMTGDHSAALQSATLTVTGGSSP